MAVPGDDGRDTTETSASEVPVATRHVMQANKSRNTKPEMLVRQKLREHGLPGYRLQWKQAPGRPDVAFPGRKVAIFVNGCFWHRCPYCALSEPKTNVDFWHEKFRRNQERDRKNEQLLVMDGWTVLVVWECRLKKKRLERTMTEVVSEIRLRDLVPSSEGALVVIGTGRSCHARSIRLIRRLAKRRHARGAGGDRHGRGRHGS